MKRKIIKTIFGGLMPLSSALLLVTTSCNVYEKVKDRPRQIDGSDWIGTADGLFDELCYIVDDEQQTVTYVSGGENIIANDLVIPNYVWWKAKKYKVLLGKECFYHATSINGSVEFNDFITDIPRNCFESCVNITKLIFHGYPKSIDDCAFSHCSKLTNIEVKLNNDQPINWAYGLEKVGMQAFESTDLSGNVIFGPELHELEPYCFCDCDLITKIDLGFTQKLKQVGSKAFYACTGVQNIVLSSAVESIADSAFAECYYLTHVVVPKETKLTLYPNAFFDCTNFEGFTSNCKIMFYNDPEVGYGEGSYFANCTSFDFNLDELLDSSVNIIPISAFENTGVTKLVVPNTINDAEDYGFYGCLGLTSIDVTHLGTTPPDWDGVEIFTSLKPRGGKVLVNSGYDKTSWTAFFAAQGLTVVDTPSPESWYFEEVE